MSLTRWFWSKATYRTVRQACTARSTFAPGRDKGFPSMHVECSKDLSRKFPVGTVFQIRAKLTDRKGEGEFLYSYHGWKFEVIELGKK